MFDVPCSLWLRRFILGNFECILRNGSRAGAEPHASPTLAGQICCMPDQRQKEHMATTWRHVMEEPFIAIVLQSSSLWHALALPGIFKRTFECTRFALERQGIGGACNRAGICDALSPIRHASNIAPIRTVSLA